MNEYRSVLERVGSNFAPLDLELENILRRRDRKRRNQRIAAGVVGIAMFVAAVWIVTSGLSLDRSEKVVVPAVSGTTGPTETGPVETGPRETAPPPAPASAAPDVVRQRTCSEGAGSRLELTDISRPPHPTRTRVRFEVYRSPVGHSWRITLHMNTPAWLMPNPTVRLTSVASDSGDLAVQGQWGINKVRAKAVDTQTGQVCRVNARI